MFLNVSYTKNSYYKKLQPIRHIQQLEKLSKIAIPMKKRYGKDTWSSAKKKHNAYKKACITLFLKLNLSKHSYISYFHYISKFQSAICRNFNPFAKTIDYSNNSNAWNDRAHLHDVTRATLALPAKI